MPVLARLRANRIDPNDRSVDMPAPFTPVRIASGSSTLQAVLEPEMEGDDVMSASEGDERFGPYTVHEALGEGGMASVHRAERDGWERNGQRAPIALKRLFRELSEDSQFVEGFLQEARLAKLLDHPNIARSYEHGKIDGQYFMAMEYVPGPTLRAAMIQSRTAAGAIPVRIVVEILTQLCDALAHAHDLRDERGRSLGLVHRDVTPANIILSTGGSVKLIDFGIAKAAHSRVQTQAGYIKGKVSYLAPEYTRGRLDHRADLFAVGVIAHEMLTGRRLFDGETQGSVVVKVRDLAIHPPSHHDPQIPHELDDIVMLALQRDPARRWQNGSAMRNALANVARQLGSPVTGKELRTWVEWAFTREPWRDSFVGELVDRFDTAEPSDSISPQTMSLSADELEVVDEVPETRPIRRVQAALLADSEASYPGSRGVSFSKVNANVVVRPTSARAADPTNAESPASRRTTSPAPKRSRVLVDRSDTARENILDGWAPPTGTALVRPNAPSRSSLPVLLLMLVLAATFAAVTLTGYLPISL
ncbi:MAG: serine/threonine protein kinase [Kofleriaceae bacterium]